MLTLKHDAIPEWDWPEMTMDFITTEAVDFAQLKEHLSLHVEVTKTASGDYQVSNIHIPDESTTEPMDMSQDSDDNVATVTGTINSLMIDHGMINISHSAIEKWNRPASTVDFIVDEGVSLVEFSRNMKVRFTFKMRDENFIITDIMQSFDDEQSEVESSIEELSVDHSNH